MFSYLLKHLLQRMEIVWYVEIFHTLWDIEIGSLSVKGVRGIVFSVSVNQIEPRPSWHFCCHNLGWNKTLGRKFLLARKTKHLQKYTFCSFFHLMSNYLWWLVVWFVLIGRMICDDWLYDLWWLVVWFVFVLILYFNHSKFNAKVVR